MKISKVVRVSFVCVVAVAFFARAENTIGSNNILQSSLPEVQITGIQRSGTNLVLEWAANKTGLSYTVEFSTNLSDGAWSPVQPTSQWWITCNSWTNTQEMAQGQYFKLKVQQSYADTDYWVPWVTKLTTNSATINWRGSDAGSGTVEYATASYYDQHHSFQQAVTSMVTGAYQHVALADLDPNAAYVYRARPSDNTRQFSNRAFKTMPVSGPFTFLVISDSHAQEKRFKYVADAIAKYETNALFILDGGDYASKDYEGYWSFYFQYGDGMLAKFPLFHAIGNHEYHNYETNAVGPTQADQYHWTFDVTNNGALNYSFDCADIRFVFLNSPDPNNVNDQDPSLEHTESQVPWLTEQLNGDKLGTFTIQHHPIYNFDRSGINANLGPWERLYRACDISANFAGHVHSYQRFSVTGTPYFVVGNGGGIFIDMDTNAPASKYFQYGATRQLGYLKVTVDPANNTASAQEIFVAYVETNNSETATVYDPPVLADTVTFPLSQKRALTDQRPAGARTVTPRAKLWSDAKLEASD